MTALLDSPPSSAAITTDKAPIWGIDQDGEEVSIPVLGLTGPYMSGKSIFGCTIAVGKNSAGKPRTRVYDIELSCKGYKGLGFDHVDVPARLRAAFGVKEYLPLDVFKFWRKDILAIEPGAFDVIFVDPITDIESGMVDYVASEYLKYGFKSQDAFQSTGGIFWKEVRESWKALLADIASRCQTFAFTAHLHKVWLNGKPTSKETPGGKSTLKELASLYLWLERLPNNEGVVPTKPRCRELLKNRVGYTSFDEATMEPIIRPYLPPAFDECTPNSIRAYIQKPADYKKLKQSERMVETKVTEMEKLEIEREISENKAKAEESALERLRRQQELAATAAAKAAPVNTDTSGQAKADEAARLAVAEAKALEFPPPAKGQDVPFTPDPPKETPKPVTPAGPALSTHEQQLALVALKSRLGMTMERFSAGVARNNAKGSSNIAEMTEAEAAALIAMLTSAAAKAGK